MSRRYIKKNIFLCISLAIISGSLVCSGCIGTSKFVSKKKRIESLEVKVDELSRELENMRLNNTKFEKRIDSVSKENDNLNTAYKKLQQDVASVGVERNESKEETSRMRKAIISTQKVVKKMHDRLLNIEENQSGLKGQIDNLIAEIDKNEAGRMPKPSDSNSIKSEEGDNLDESKVVLEYMGSKRDLEAESSGSEGLDSKLREAQELSDKGRLDEAISLYNEVLNVETKNTEAYYGIGNAYYDKGQINEAIKAYKSLLKASPDNAEAHLSLGVSYARIDKLDEAVAEFNKALTINADMAEAHIGLSAVYLKKGMYDDAILAGKKAIKIDPELAKAHKYLSIAYEKKGMTKEAKQELDLYNNLNKGLE